MIKKEHLNYYCKKTNKKKKKKKKGKRKKRKEKKNKNSFRKVFFNTARLVITGRAKCVMCYFLKN